MAAFICRQQSKTITQEVLGETGPGDSLMEQDIGHTTPAAAAGCCFGPHHPCQLREYIIFLTVKTWFDF